jgi:hypothetical protein
MHTNMKKLFSTALILCLLALPLFTMAGGPGGPGDPGCDPLDPACPIDGGLGLLLAAGLGLGAKKAYQARKQKKTTQA